METWSSFWKIGAIVGGGLLALFLLFSLGFVSLYWASHQFQTLRYTSSLKPVNVTLPVSADRQTRVTLRIPSAFLPTLGDRWNRDADETRARLHSIVEDISRDAFTLLPYSENHKARFGGDYRELVELQLYWNPQTFDDSLAQLRTRATRRVTRTPSAKDERTLQAQAQAAGMEAVGVNLEDGYFHTSMQAVLPDGHTMFLSCDAPLSKGLRPRCNLYTEYMSRLVMNLQFDEDLRPHWRKLERAAGILLDGSRADR